MLSNSQRNIGRLSAIPKRQQLAECAHPALKVYGQATETGVNAATNSLVLASTECLAAGRHYAQISGRLCQPFDTWMQLKAALSYPHLVSAILVMPASSLTIEKLWEIHDLSKIVSRVGVIPMAAKTEEAQIKQCSAIWRSATSAPFTNGVSQLMGNIPPMDADRTGILDSLQAGVECLVYVGHGNGVDFKLEPGTLCSLANGQAPFPPKSPVPSKSSRVLPCQAGGVCMRRAEVFVGPDLIRARLHVMMTCWGFLPSDGHLDQEGSWTLGLLSSGSAAAVVTTFGVVATSEHRAHSIAKAVLRGDSAGHITARLNGLNSGVPYVCFGDPDVAISDCLQQPTPQRRAGVKASTVPPTLVVKNSNIFLSPFQPSRVYSDYLDSLLAKMGSPKGRSKATSRAHWECIASGYVISRNATPYLGFGGHSAGVAKPVIERGDHGCGARLLKIEYSLLNSGSTGGRAMWLCSRCGIVGDVPGHWAAPSMVVNSDCSVDISIPLEAPSGEGWLTVCNEQQGMEMIEPRDPIRLLRIRGDHNWKLPTNDKQRGLGWVGAAFTWANSFALLRAAVYHDRVRNRPVAH